MHPTRILSSVFLTLLAQGQIIGAMPLERQPNGSHPNVDALEHLLHAGGTEGTGSDWTTPNSIGKRMEPSAIVQLTATCVGGSASLTILAFTLLNHVQKARICGRCAAVLNQVEEARGHAPSHTADEVQKDIEDGAPKAKTVAEVVGGIAGAIH
ncbi:hypothetical protein ANO11243_091540 [Dothideomycetidae sp. 11243]|nr:hypothetical protein ANO11243_091540 [fungal sp. No.11243]